MRRELGNNGSSCNRGTEAFGQELSVSCVMETSGENKWRNSRWKAAVRPKGSGEGLLPGRLRPGMAEREATGTYSRRSWKQALPRGPGTEPGQSILQIQSKPARPSPTDLGRAEP